MQTLGGYDAVTGHVFALGFNGSSGERELVDLDPVALDGAWRRAKERLSGTPDREA